MLKSAIVSGAVMAALFVVGTAIVARENLSQPLTHVLAVLLGACCAAIEFRRRRRAVTGGSSTVGPGPHS